MPETTTPQLSESDVNDFESSLLLAVGGKAMVRVDFAAALIRDLRALRAQVEKLLDDASCEICDAVLYDEHGKQVQVPICNSCWNRLSAENAALREQLAQRTVELEREGREMQKWNNRANQLAIEGQSLRQQLAQAHARIEKQDAIISAHENQDEEALALAENL